MGQIFIIMLFGSWESWDKSSGWSIFRTSHSSKNCVNIYPQIVASGSTFEKWYARPQARITNESLELSNPRPEALIDIQRIDQDFRFEPQGRHVVPFEVSLIEYQSIFVGLPSEGGVSRVTVLAELLEASRVSATHCLHHVPRQPHRRRRNRLRVLSKNAWLINVTHSYSVAAVLKKVQRRIKHERAEMKCSKQHFANEDGDVISYW